MTETHWGMVAGVLVVGFLYFLYTRVKKSRNKSSGSGGGGGGGGKLPKQPVKRK